MTTNRIGSGLLWTISETLEFKKKRKVIGDYVTNTFEQIPSWEANGYPANHLEDEISLPCLQQPAICPYPGPNQKSSHPPLPNPLTCILMLSAHLDLRVCLSRGFFAFRFHYQNRAHIYQLLLYQVRQLAKVPKFMPQMGK